MSVLLQMGVPVPRRLSPAAPPLLLRPAADVPLDDGWDKVQARWSRAGKAPQTQARLVQVGARFITRLQALGVQDWARVDTNHCWGFVTAPTADGREPSVATQHLRRATLRAIFRALRELRMLEGDPTLDLHLPRRPSRAYRPLTDPEILLGRAASRLGTPGGATLRRAVAWALAEAGGATSEIAQVQLDQVTLTPDRVLVAFPDSRRYTARTVPLTSWGSAILTRHVTSLVTANAPGGTVLAYAGHSDPGAYRAQASVCTQLTRVLTLAGLATDPGVHARSVRGWAGRTHLETGHTLQEVAAFLGNRTLDATAAEIGLSWGSGRNG